MGVVRHLVKGGKVLQAFPCGDADGVAVFSLLSFSQGVCGNVVALPF